MLEICDFCYNNIMNYIDLFIIFALIYYAYSGYRYGFLRVFFDIAALVISFSVSLFTYSKVGSIINRSFQMKESFSAMLSFFIVWFVAELILYVVFHFISIKLPEKIKTSDLNRYAGIIPSILKGLLIISIFASVLATLPFPTSLKDEILKSKIGHPLAKNVKFLDNATNKIFGDALKESVEFMTIKPGSDEKLTLDFKTKNVTIDTESESKMLQLINEERKKAGLNELTINEKAVEVARKHSRDMFERGYFAHVNPDGLSPFDRMEKGGVTFMVAGENLALAPDVDMAHKGLMDSPGHRANILSPDFKRVGIGVIDGGKYGKMFTQNFTD